MGQALNIQLKESVIDVDGLYIEDVQLIKKLVEFLKHQKHNSRAMAVDEERERMGWLALVEKNLADIWDNPIDEKIWSQFLDYKMENKKKTQPKRGRFGREVSLPVLYTH